MKRLFVILAILLIILSCEEIIEVPDISEETVNVLAPGNGLVLTITDVNFAWMPIEEADQYKLQIATPSFEGATQIVLDTTIVTANFTKSLDIGNYEWRLRAENSGYQTVFSIQSFTIEE